MILMIPIDALLCRLQRDIAERGRELDSVLKQYEKFVKPVSFGESCNTMEFCLHEALKPVQVCMFGYVHV